MAKSIKFKNNTYLDSTSIVHKKTKLSDLLNKNAVSIIDNPSTDINISSSTKILSKDVVINSGKVLIIGTIYLTHGGGTPTVNFVIDGNIVATFYASKIDNVYTFSSIANNLSVGSHNVYLQINKGNASNVVAPAYTARNLTIVEI